MKIILSIPSALFLIILLTISSCASTSNVSNPGASNTDNSNTEISDTANEGRDGMSFETAIIANSIPEEYEWLKKNYPGSRVSMQALANHDGKPYDILTFKTSDGETKKAYFDISNFFGKF
ncbi:MAG: hypothetical protein OEW75_00545 [Cyclobacteriaceae bacterium]|nr:hypothetical protein [Cyclobacteriaceae bacterium]